MGALPRPGVSAGPHRELVEALHDLHHRAGLPSLRRIAADAGCSHTTVSHILSGPRVPTWDHLRAVVETLGGDPEEFYLRWLTVTSPDPQPVHEVPLVGRDDELAAGRRFLREHGRLLLLRGEAGTGKTRLLHAISDRSERLVLGARCVPLSQGEPLMPLAGALRVALRVDQGGWVTDALRALPDSVTPSLAVLVPELGEADLARGVDGAFARHRLFTAACLLMTALDAERPCMLQLDDLHWADDSTRDFISFAATYDEGPPILGAWRLGDPEVGHTADVWRTHVVGLPGATTLTVGPLDETESLAQLRWLGIDDPTTARALHQRSGGLPLFTEHLARAADTDGLPERLADLLTQRLRGVLHEGRRVCDVLALLDRPVTAQELPELTGLTLEAVTIGLHHLADRHLLDQTTDTVALSHPLLAQAARDTLLPTERLDHHRRIATALEHHPDAAPSEIALHWRATGDTDRTLPWEVRAALAAERRFALVEAGEHWRHALDAWPPELTRPDGIDVTRRTAQLRALTALYHVHHPQAMALATSVVADVAAQAGPEPALLLERCAWIFSGQGDAASALTLIEQAAEMLESLPPSTTQIEVLESQEYHLTSLGRYAEARQVAERARVLCRATGDHWRVPSIMADIAVLDLLEGDGAATRKHLAASAPEAGQVHETYRMSHAAGQRTFVLARSEAGPDAVAAAAAPVLRTARRWSIDNFLVDIVRGNVSGALRRAGRVVEAEAIVGGIEFQQPDARHASSHLELAAIGLACGKRSESLARALALSELPADTLFARSYSARAVADIELWCGRPHDASRRLFELCEEDPDTVNVLWGAEVLATAARAGADLIEASSPPPFDIAARLRAIRNEATEDPFAPLDTVPSRLALHAQWRGELGRIDGKPDVEAWSTAIRRWDELGRPFDAAYCRWRAAQACLQLGQATAAARLLRRGLKDAREHVPLRDALTATLRELTGA